MNLNIERIEYLRGAMVEYVVLNDATVVYCGVTNIRHLSEEASTTNAALDILRALAAKINKPVETLAFFELSTHVSWIFRPGEYDFHSVKPYRNGQKEGVCLTRVRAPKIILETFRNHIGGDAIHKYTPGKEEMVDEVS